MDIKLGGKIYICPKCGGNGHKERIEITSDEGEQFSPSTGDIVCEKCGYVGSKTEFEDKEDSVDNAE